MAHVTQAVCEMLTFTGKDLEGDKKELNGYFSILDTWAERLPTRVLLMVQDLVNLRKDGWAPRHKILQVWQARKGLGGNDNQVWLAVNRQWLQPRLHNGTC